ncbi:MAG TPA: hypothetical protein VFN87_12145 [Solirubrobacteraceae bacterium]|nr:hypothetical protein [Solirubrobacteraceae bacterium]
MTVDRLWTAGVRVAVGLLGGLWAAALLTAPVAAAQSGADTKTFSYTGAEQSWVVPDGVTAINVTAYGALGGGNPGVGHGQIATGTITVTPGETLYIEVGGQGGASNSATYPCADANFANDQTTCSGAHGGFNGGGESMGGPTNDPYLQYPALSGDGGGGGSDVQTVSGPAPAVGGPPAVSAPAVASRLIVAGGGGGDGSYGRDSSNHLASLGFGGDLGGTFGAGPGDGSDGGSWSGGAYNPPTPGPVGGGGGSFGGGGGAAGAAAQSGQMYWLSGAPGGNGVAGKGGWGNPGYPDNNSFGAPTYDGGAGGGGGGGATGGGGGGGGGVYDGSSPDFGGGGGGAAGTSMVPSGGTVSFEPSSYSGPNGLVTFTYAAGVGSTGTPTGGPGSTTGKGGTGKKTKTEDGTPSIATVLGSKTKVTVKLKCKGATGTRCPTSLALSVIESVRSGKITAVSAAARAIRRTVVIGSRNVTVRAGRSAKVMVSINASGRRLLRRYHQLSTLLSVRQGKRLVLTRRVKIGK